MTSIRGWVLALAASAIATTALAQSEVRITHTMTGDASKVALDKIVADFEAANPDIKVVQLAFDDDVYDTALSTQLQGTEVPDIYFQWAGYAVSRDAKAGIAADLSAALATDGWGASFLDSVWGSGAGTMYEGKPYMMPISLDVTNTIWYNQAIFEEYGLVPPKTWDEFVGIVKTLSDAGELPIVQGNKELWPFGNWASHIAAMVVPPQEYAAAFTREGKFSTPNFERAFGYIDQLRQAGGFNRDMQGLGADPAMATFLEGSAAMHPVGSWLIASAKQMADPELRYSQFNTPPLEPDSPLNGSVIGVTTGFMLNAKAPNPEGAIRFLKFFSDSQNQKLWAESGALSPVKGVNQAADLDANTMAMAQMLDTATAMVPVPDTTYDVAFAEAYYQAAAYVAAGEKSPKDALAWLDETITAMGPQ